MKKLGHIAICLVCIIILSGCYEGWPLLRSLPEGDQPRSRVTNVLVSDGSTSAVMRDLLIPGTVSDAAGVQTIQLDELESSDDQNLISVVGGVWTFTNDGGSTSYEVGSGAANEYVETNSTKSVTVDEIKAGIIIEVYGSTTITLPALSGFSAGETGRITVWARNSAEVTIEASGSDNITLGSDTDTDDIESSGTDYQYCELVPAGSTTGWMVINNSGFAKAEPPV